MKIDPREFEEMLQRPARLGGVAHLLLARHGEYDEDTGNLIDVGRAQMEALAVELVRLDLGLAVLCSVAPRAIESARIIADALGQTPIQTEALGNEFGRNRLPPQEVWRRIKELVPQASGLLLIVHGPMMDALGSYCLKTAKMEDPHRSLYATMQDQACWIDATSGIVSVVNEPD